MMPKKDKNKDSQERKKVRDGLEKMIDEREMEYELQMDAQARLTHLQTEVDDLKDQLVRLDPLDERFARDQSDILKVLVVLMEQEIPELKEEVGEEILKRIGPLYWSVDRCCFDLMKRINEGEFSTPQKSSVPESGNEEVDLTQEASETCRKGGYISSISIENFKGIGEKVIIPLKPITLMFGANSAGKSTVLQALLYAHEVLNNNNPDADKTEFGGEWVNLGGFRNLVHNHDVTKEIEIGFEYVLDDDGLPKYGPERNYSGSLGEALFYDTEVFRDLQTVSVNFSIQMHASIRPYVAKYQVEINGELTAVLLRESPEEEAYFSYLNMDHVVDSECGIPEAEQVTTMVLAAVYNPKMEELKHQAFGSEKKGVPEEARLSLAGQDALPPWGEILPFLRHVDFVHQEEWVDAPDDSVVYALLSAVVSGPGELIANALKSHRYIGPIRAMPPRNYAPQHTKDASRWANGMAGWDELFSDVLAGEKWFDQQAIDQLGLEYGFRVQTQIIADGQADLAFAYKRGERIVRMHDIKNGIDMEPCDVGTGVSQVIPVVAGAMSPGCNFLSVEQPELHLHPAIQCNLGDLFISQMHRYPERTFLLETHSEHMILRLLRRIRETANNELEDPSLALTPADVGVLYVDELKDGVSITELPINEEGDFTRKWPKGFFAERAEELF